MIIVCPNTKDDCGRHIVSHPKLGFLMISDAENKINGGEKSEIRDNLDEIFEFHDLKLMDAMSVHETTDNYCKICDLIQSSAFGIAFITENTSENAKSNIYLEIGLMKTFGKDVIILTDNREAIASDLKGKGILEFKKFSEMQSKIQEYLQNFPKDIIYFKRLGDNWFAVKDYEKSFEYYKKAVMLGDFSTSFRTIKEKFVEKTKLSSKITKDLRTQIGQFINDVEEYQKTQVKSKEYYDKKKSEEISKIGEPSINKRDVPSIALTIADLPKGWYSERNTVVGDFWEYSSSFRDSPTRFKIPTLKSVIYHYNSNTEAKIGFALAKNELKNHRLFLPNVGDESYGYISGYPLGLVIFRRQNLLVRTEYKCNPSDPTIDDAEKYAQIVDERIKLMGNNS